jgi:hypothetical protein
MARHKSKLARKYRRKAEANPPAGDSKKKRAKHVRRRKRSPVAVTVRRNPTPAVDWMDLGTEIGAGFAGFAASRLTTRIVSVQLAKRAPTYAKHAGVASSLATFLAAVLLAKRWKHTEKYADALAFGSGLALLQTVIQTYIPGLGWIVADCSPEVAAAAQPAAVAPASQGGLLDDDDSDDDSWFSYNDAYDRGRHAPSAQPRASQQRSAAAPAPQQTRATQATGPAPGAGEDDDVDSLLADLDDDSLGVFAN